MRRRRGGMVALATTGILATGCASQGSEVVAAPSAGAETSYTAVYYQPRATDLRDPASLEVPTGTYVMTAEPDQPSSWTIGNCRPDNAARFLQPNAAPNAARVAGFSLGRIGFPYLLSTAAPGQIEHIKYSIIFDPGNREDFTDSCDPANTSELFADWLGHDEERRLVVIAGRRTAEEDYVGIRDNYFAALGTVASQVIICSFPDVGHEAVWNANKELVTAPPIMAPEDCPPGAIAWQPKA